MKRQITKKLYYSALNASADDSFWGGCVNCGSVHRGNHRYDTFMSRCEDCDHYSVYGTLTVLNDGIGAELDVDPPFGKPSENFLFLVERLDPPGWDQYKGFIVNCASEEEAHCYHPKQGYMTKDYFDSVWPHDRVLSVKKIGTPLPETKKGILFTAFRAG